MKIFFVLMFSIACLFANAQIFPTKSETVPIHFLHNGLLDSIPSSKIYKKQKFYITIDPPSNKISDSVKKKFLSDLGKKIKSTITNLKDKQLGFDDFYITLWNNDIYTEIINELTDLLKYAKGQKYKMNCGDFQYTPSPCDFENLFSSSSSLISTHKYNPDSQRHEIIIQSNDLYKLLLINKFNETFIASSLYKWRDDPNTQDNWDELSKLRKTVDRYSKDLQNIDTLFSPRINDIATDIIEFNANKIEKNDLILEIKNDSYLKKWIWFNLGAFSLNPFSDTVLIHWPKIAKLDTPKYLEATKYIEENKKYYNGSDTNLSYPFALANMDSNAIKKRFTKDSVKIDTFKSIGINSLQNVNKIENKVLLPATTEYKKDYPIWINNYYADKKYKQQKYHRRKDKFYKIVSVPANETIAYIVHNVPQNISIISNQKNTPIIDASDFQNELKSISNVDFGSIASAFNGLNIATNPSSIPIRQSVGYAIHNKYIYKGIANVLDDINDNRIEFLEEYFSREIIANEQIVTYIRTFIALNGSDYNISGLDENKKKIVLAKLVDGFKIYFIDFIRKTEPIKRALNALKEDSIVLTVLLNLPNQDNIIADMPPQKLEIRTNQNPTYRTVVNLPDIDPDSPSKVKYNLMEIKPKDVSTIKNNNKDTIPPKITYDTTLVIKSTFKFAKKHIFQLAGGVTWTQTPYPYATQPYVKQASITNGQLSVNTDQQSVNFVAGVDIYPWKLFLLDNSFLGLRNRMFMDRLSIFVGVGFPHPLFHYYFGIGVDIIPGFRILGGMQLIQYTDFQLENNQIFTQSSSLQIYGPFVGAAIDPVTLIQYLALFK